MPSDTQRAELEPFAEACRPHAKVPSPDLRRAVEAIIWGCTNGAKWRSIPAEILALTDALGTLVHLRLMPGQRSDSVDVPPSIDGIAFGGPIADKAWSWVPGSCLRHAPD